MLLAAQQLAFPRVPSRARERRARTSLKRLEAKGPQMLACPADERARRTEDWFEKKDFVELELRTYLNLRTSPEI